MKLILNLYVLDNLSLKYYQLMKVTIDKQELLTNY